tara:strand:+ start:1126 stop:1311 length:186 start_codon:yes stop_codon:yes gene_type:complete
MEPVSFIIVAALQIIPCWKALEKAGMAPALSLIALIPGLGLLIVLFILAYGRWPAINDGRR